jgi:acyl carrier protein
MNELLNILSDVRPDVDFSQTELLVEDGILDSFDIVMLVGEINEAYDIKIGVEDLVPENFNSVDAIMNLINRLKDE